MKKLFPVVIVVTVFTVFFFISCSLMVKEEIFYEVDTSLSKKEADTITYTDANGDYQSLSNVSLPWSKTIKITFGEDQELEEVYLTATTSDTTSADVTVKITWTK